jgi:hypothetical protein
MPKTNLQQQISVHALSSKVWKVLTNADYVNQYLLKGNVSSDWMEGNPILLITENNESINIGTVLQSDPGMLLKFRLREESSANHVTITYELIVAGDGVEIKMKCEGFTASDQEYFLRVQQARLVLQKIKWLAEYG